jgi:hypothetical protein
VDSCRNGRGTVKYWKGGTEREGDRQEGGKDSKGTEREGDKQGGGKDRKGTEREGDKQGGGER